MDFIIHCSIDYGNFGVTGILLIITHSLTEGKNFDITPQPLLPPRHCHTPSISLIAVLDNPWEDSLTVVA